MRRVGRLGLAWVLVWASAAAGGEFNSVLKIGDVAPAWKKLPGTDGGEHALDDLKDQKLVVVVFTCNSCPYAVDYEDRIKAIAQTGAAAVVAINSNLAPDDSLENMKQRAAAKKFAFPYLFDASQQIAKAYGALRTPEFFLLDGERRVVYMGALDDNTDPAKVQKHYLADAIAAALNGQPAKIAETPPIGCAIRFARPRRR